MRRLGPSVLPATLVAGILLIACWRPGPVAVAQTPLPEAYGLVDVWLPETPTGVFLFHPTGVTTDGRGNVIVAEAGNGRLTRASPRGTDPTDPQRPPQRIGRLGSAPGELRAPEDVAATAAGDRLYVADTGNRRVQVLSVDGHALALWPDVGLPRGIAVGPATSPEGATILDGRVYIADAEAGLVRVHDRDGTWLESWALGPGASRPLGLSVAPSGDLVVADHAAQRIVWLDADASAGPRGAVVGTLALDNAAGPGGAPTDVAVDTTGEVYVAVARAVLRFRPSGPPGPGTGVAAALAYASAWPMLRNELPEACLERGCATPNCAALVVEEKESHEGVQRLHLRPGGALYVTYAPALRWPDRVVVFPALPGGGVSPPHYREGWVWPLLCRDYSEAEYRHATDMERLDTGPEPYYSVGLDSAATLRVRKGDGAWYGGMRAMQAVPGQDLAVNRTGGADPTVAILDANRVHLLQPQCLIRGFAPRDCLGPSIRVLDGAQIVRRERTNECRRGSSLPWRPDDEGPCIPDDRWWNTAVGHYGRMVPVLDTGMRRLVVRDVAGGQLVAQVSLGAVRDPFRAFVDLDYDQRGRLWVLAADGAVRLFDERGRDLGEMALAGPAAGRAAALSVAPDGSFFVLTGDERVVKYAPDVAPPATPTPTLSPTPGPSPRPTRVPPRPTATPRPTLPSRAVALAAWRIEDHAGPGRYRDLDVADDERVIVPDADNDRHLVFDRVASVPTPGEPEPPGLGPCRFVPEKAAAPDRIQLGETTEVTLGLPGSCGSRHEAVDVVAVVDVSCQMAGERFARAREGLEAMVDALALPQDRMGIVTFLEDQGGARVLVPLTADRQRLRDAARTITTDCRFMDACLELDFRNLAHVRSFLYPYGCRTEGRISDGLRAGREALFGPDGRPEAGKALVLLSSSLHDSRHILATLSLDPETFDPPQTAEEAALWRRDLAVADPLADVTDRTHARWEGGLLRDLGVRVLTTGVGVDGYGAGHPPDEGLLAALAWPADGYRPAGAPEDLRSALEAHGRDISARVLMASVAITDRIPANMRLVPGSVRPPARVLPDGSRPDGLLAWTFADVPTTGLPVLSYRLEPLEAGRWPTNIEAFAEHVDGLGYPGRSVFGVPHVEVIGPSPTPTATPTDEPTPTDAPASPTPPPTATIVPTATPSPTTGPSPVPRPFIYLPYVSRWRCKPSPRPVDVLLAIDTSSSMTGDKLEAARRAAVVFVGLLDLRPARDRAALVRFDSTAALAQPLTHDRSALVAALAALEPSPGTRIDLGLETALSELVGPRRRLDADRAIVLLTDGRPLPGTEDAAAAVGVSARSAGVSTWAIGLGADVDPEMLVTLAGTADQVLVAPTPSDLEEVYRRVAGGIICR